MKTGKTCELSDIRVGEVFAVDGCWTIIYKESEDVFRLLADDYTSYPMIKPMEEWALWIFAEKIYKLPQSVQKLWKT